MLLLLIASLGLADDGTLGQFASIEVRPFIRPLLKSPASAQFGYTEVSPAAPSACLRQGRYIVDGYVDSQNGFGALIRSEWKGVVALDQNKRPELLFVTFKPSGGKEVVVAKAEASRRFRPEVYQKVRDVHREKEEKLREQMKKLPASKKKAFYAKAGRTFVADCKRLFDLDPEEVLEILGKKLDGE